MKFPLIIGMIVVFVSATAVIGFTLGPDDDPTLGTQVTIVEFADFQGPFSKLFWEETLPLLKDNYINTGIVTYTFRDFPLSFYIHDQLASEASECADEQGAYWTYHDLLFAKQDQWSGLTTEDAKTAFVRYAGFLGLDKQSFDTCLNSGSMTSEVLHDAKEGTAAGVSGTPWFFILTDCGYQDEIVGAQPYSVFASSIDAAIVAC